MNADDHRDQLIDMLLREAVGGESPPDVREKVLAAAAAFSARPVTHRAVRQPRRVPLPRPASRSRAPVFAMAALFAVLAVAAGLVYVQRIASARTPMVTEVSGTVDRATGPLRPGEIVSTGAQSTAVLTYPDGTVVELDAETTLRVVERSWEDPSKEVDLVVGRIQATVAPQEVDQPMMLSSGDANVEVVGTRLSLEHDDSGTRLEVTEGAVRFTPNVESEPLLVKSGAFAETTGAVLRSGTIRTTPRRGILRFTLMNADSDEPLRETPLSDGETLSLGSLPTKAINFRADYESESPVSVRIRVSRDDGQPTGILPSASNTQMHPPFFAAGDHWADGRPNDCRGWVPQPGTYRITARASYADDEGEALGQPLKMQFHIVE